MYFFMLVMSLSLSNWFLVWFLMEMMLLFLFLSVLVKEEKSVGLVIYFFFQSVMSLLLLCCVVFMMEMVIFFLLLGKLGLFPFFYWVVVVSCKVGYYSNIFILSFQKMVIFWLLWLLSEVSFSVLLWMVYMSVVFVVISLLSVSDLWLLLVYSSIASSGMILFGLLGMNYFFSMLLYLGVVCLIIWVMKSSSSLDLVAMIVFLFLVVPPFILFFMKFFLMMSMDLVMKVILFFTMLDVVMLLYYFSLVFMKFMLMEMSFLVYFMSMTMLLLMLMFSNCVAMVVFYES